MNVQEAADYLRIKKSTLYKKVMLKEVPFYKFGGRVLFKPDELDRLIQADHVPVRRGVMVEG